MPFNNNYHNLVSEKSQAHTRLIHDYQGQNKDFDFIIIGSGMGGGILADELADSSQNTKRILVIDVGSFIYPTHVYNISRHSNEAVAPRFGVVNFNRDSESHGQLHISKEPQMALGGRSIFWSGLIPTPKTWECNFFPDEVKTELESNYFEAAGEKMNQSASLGKFAEDVVKLFNKTDLANDFDIEQTPRAVHQPYLYADGTPREKYFHEPTGVFNTAELLINQVGLTNDHTNFDGNGLFVKLNSFAESITDTPEGWHKVTTTDTISGEQDHFYAPKVIIAAGSTESPKLINRSSVFHRLPDNVKNNVGSGLTDHPVSSEAQIFAKKVIKRDTHGNVVEDLPIDLDDHAKIVFYSKGETENGSIKYPFNIELNINHEYWHLRNNDPTDGMPDVSHDDANKIRVDIKFSFANLLDDNNRIYSHYNDGYKPYIKFSRWHKDHLLYDRFPKLSGWTKTESELRDLLLGIKDRIFNCFEIESYVTDPFYNYHWPFGYGTVHHACGSLRMPWKPDKNQGFNYNDSVVDTDLKVKATSGLYVCDMSVMPISTAANPVRALAGLALRLSKHLLDNS